ncbi:MAG TPA: hypothetical protein VKV20_19975 [Ktedonobacteraceae bacterium]|jgi:hypothetical protein|nr:hypothetical protein [Ktedonobacteraceae bacterium]
MVPPQFANFFVASASAGAALVGLLFVAVSIAPQQTVTRRAPIEQQVVAGGAFTALINAFFLSLVTLIPNFSFGTIILPFSALCLADMAGGDLTGCGYLLACSRRVPPAAQYPPPGCAARRGVRAAHAR